MNFFKSIAILVAAACVQAVDVNQLRSVDLSYDLPLNTVQGEQLVIGETCVMIPSIGSGDISCLPEDRCTMYDGTCISKSTAYKLRNMA